MTAYEDCEWQWWESAIVVAVIAGIFGVLEKIVEGWMGSKVEETE